MKLRLDNHSVNGTDVCEVLDDNGAVVAALYCQPDGVRFFSAHLDEIPGHEYLTRFQVSSNPNSPEFPIYALTFRLRRKY